MVDGIHMKVCVYTTVMLIMYTISIYIGGQIFEIPLGGTLVKQKFAIGGSGSTYIFGLVDSLYRDNMTKEECKEFVKKSM